MFRLSVLKPPHGWTVVAYDLAIVTIGVLIALGQIVGLHGALLSSRVKIVRH